ncbi:transcriptional regulator [Novosphingobium humi]|uniref:transcriptional regulator n=1 Tax=Novosphingobium humi TaxID=2282397 RepID=UPI0025B0AF55|nr:YdaS family helix-turn-helix protein [Novosphingobium humi]WJS98225.1 helix-turn-helix domain-containing protein [Novosphingobium humi]
MTDIPSPFEALQAALERAGSQSALARLCGVSQPSVWKWLQSSKRLPGEHVLTVEAATGVSRHHLRPDLYPLDLAPGPRWYGVDMAAGGDQVSVSVWRHGRNGNRFIALDGHAQRIAR